MSLRFAANAKPCPFCGKTDMVYSHDMPHSKRDLDPYIWCMNCGARGPQSLTLERKDTLEAWNTRQP